MTSLDDADLALIEINNPSALVQRLIWRIRELEDELVSTQVERDDLVIGAERYIEQVAVRRGEQTIP